jgi:hypothetical protein
MFVTGSEFPGRGRDEERLLGLVCGEGERFSAGATSTGTRNLGKDEYHPTEN